MELYEKCKYLILQTILYCEGNTSINNSIEKYKDFHNFVFQMNKWKVF